MIIGAERIKSMQKLNCLNPACQHRWYPRIPDPPLLCPLCRSRHWNDKEYWAVRKKVEPAQSATETETTTTP